jgi:hypothetical protein
MNYETQRLHCFPDTVREKHEEQDHMVFPSTRRLHGVYLGKHI